MTKWKNIASAQKTGKAFLPFCKKVAVWPPYFGDTTMYKVKINKYMTYEMPRGWIDTDNECWEEPNAAFGNEDKNLCIRMNGQAPLFPNPQPTPS